MLSATPEEQELAAKRSELDALEVELADRELELNTLTNQLRAFEQQYFRVMGPLYAELDELEAQIAEAEARIRPHEPRLSQRASEARNKAADSATAVNAIVSTSDDRFEPNDEIRKLYREVAKRVHPDFADDDVDRAHRTVVMTEANRAYATGDVFTLKRILDDWNMRPENVKGEGVALELVRAIRKIHQIQRRLSEIRNAISELTRSPIYQLWTAAKQAAVDDRNLFSEMQHELERKIDLARAHLSRVSMTWTTT